VAYFGIRMETRWTTARQDRYTARVALDVVDRGTAAAVQFRPTVRVVSSSDRTTISSDRTTISSDRTTISSDRTTISPDRTTISPDRTTISPDRTTISSTRTTGPSVDSRDIQRTDGSGRRVSVGGSGPENVTGVVQSIQIAGESNSVHNDTLLDVVFQDEDPPIIESTPDPGNTVTVATEHGAVITAGLDNEGVRVSVDTPEGSAVQRITSANFGLDSGIQQTVKVGGRFNEIVNTLHLQAGLSGPSIPAVDLSRTLQSLHGLIQAGQTL